MSRGPELQGGIFNFIALHIAGSSSASNMHLRDHTTCLHPSAFPPFLGFQREGGNRPCLETLYANFFTGLLTVPVCSLVDTLDRLIDFRNQLSIPISGSLLQARTGFYRSLIQNIDLLNTVFS